MLDKSTTLPRAAVHAPAGATAAKRPGLYLVGEAERSSPRPKAGAAGRTMVLINRRWHALRGRTASFEQLLRIAFPMQPLHNPEAATVSYWAAGGAPLLAS